MENYPQERAQDAVCQSHTGHMTGLWFLPARPVRLNNNEWMCTTDSKINSPQRKNDSNTGSNLYAHYSQLHGATDKLLNTFVAYYA